MSSGSSDQTLSTVPKRKSGDTKVSLFLSFLIISKLMMVIDTKSCKFVQLSSMREHRPHSSLNTLTSVQTAALASFLLLVP